MSFAIVDFDGNQPTFADNVALAVNVTTTPGSSSVLVSAPGTGTAAVQITGTWTGTLSFQATVDGTNWFAVPAVVPGSGAIVTSTIVNGAWLLPVAGYAQVRVLGPTATGTAVVSIEASAGTQATSLASSLPAGSNIIGAVTQSGSWDITVSGTVAATQSGPWNVGQSGTWIVQQGTPPWDQNLVEVGGVAITLGQKPMATSFPVVLASDQSAIPVTQSGPWTVAATQSGPWTTGRTWTLAFGTDSVTSFQGGSWNVGVIGSVTVTGTVAATQSGPWTMTSLQGTSPWITSDLADGAVINGATGSKSMLAGLIYTTSPPSLTPGNQNSLLGDIHGNLLVNLQTPIPAGSNTIGAVNQAGAPWSISGTVVSDQGTSPWIVAGGGVAGTPATGVVTVQGIAGGTPIPISGSILATNPSVGLTGAIAPTSATEIGGIDLSGDLQAPGITLASVAATAPQQALVVALSPNSPLPAGSHALGSVNVTGTVAVTQSTSPWVTSISTPLPAGGNTIGAVDQAGAPWLITGTGTTLVPAPGIVTIQGNPAGVPVPIEFTSSLQVTQDTSPWVTRDQADGAVTNGGVGTYSMLAGLVYPTSTPTILPGNQNSLLGDVHGNLLVSLQTPLPAGTNLIGEVTGSGSAGTPAPGVVTIQGITGGTPVPISGTITATDASVGLTGAPVPASATQIGGVDPTGNLEAPGITPPSTAATAVQPALVVAFSPNSPAPPATISPNLANSQIDPGTGLQTNNLTSSGGLSSAQTPVATSCLYNSLGGEYYLKSTPGSENLLGVFAYQVPVGRTLYITNVILPPPGVVQQFGNSGGVQLWQLFVANSNNPSVAVGIHFPIATFGLQGGQIQGSNLSGGGEMQLSFLTPVTAAAGKWVLICFKIVSGGTSTGAFRGMCHINGYFG